MGWRSDRTEETWGAGGPVGHSRGPPPLPTGAAPGRVWGAPRRKGLGLSTGEQDPSLVGRRCGRFQGGCLGGVPSQPPWGAPREGQPWGPRPPSQPCTGEAEARPSRGPGAAGTWTQPAVLRQPLQAVLQQHRDDPVQVGHLAGGGGRRRRPPGPACRAAGKLLSGCQTHPCLPAAWPRGRLPHAPSPPVTPPCCLVLVLPPRHCPSL